MQILAYILALVYTLSTTGVPVYAHLCGGEVVSTAAFAPGKACCEGKAQKKPCCEQKVKLAKSQVDQKVGQEVKVSFQSPALLPVKLLMASHVSVVLVQHPVVLLHQLDLPPPEPLWLIYGSLRLGDC